MSQQSTDRKTNLIANWLFLCCGTIFCMIIVGAITRLSGSGLSMVEWRPLIGFLPPLNEEEWLRVFDLYQNSPEYLKKNHWMELADFKEIFFWEWFHRVLGRGIGVIYALPLLFFFIKGWIPKNYKLALIGGFVLGGLQGLMGWYMVKSGLVDNPEVSHYRLAAHLSLALIIYVYLFWLGMNFRRKARGDELTAPPEKNLYRHGLITLITLALTMSWGAYTAGLDAGLVYNDTFPKMGETWIPMEMWHYKPLWINFFEKHAGVQFTHRWLAILTLLITISFVAHAARKQQKSWAYPVLGIIVIGQFALGIATLFSGVALPVAVLHQAGAVTLLTVLIYCVHFLKYPPKQVSPHR